MITDEEMIGNQYGWLVVMERAPRIRQKSAWWVRCVCGSVLAVRGNALRTGNTKSCGCSMKTATALRTHGLSQTRAHGCWKAAKQRCFNPNASNYRHYGGKGITMAPAWAEDFAVFYAAMGECPPGQTLERIRTSGNYEPGNCRWATQAEQVRNTSRTIFVEIGKGRMVLKDFAALRGVNYNKLRLRMVNLGEDAHAAAARLLEHQPPHPSIAPGA